MLAAPAAAQLAEPPDWAADALWYQVFPERFRNGDPRNDPTWASLEFPDVVPESLWARSVWTADWYARQRWEEAIGPDFYEHGVFHRRYGGDLQGVLDTLPYLDSLGVNALYFNPVFYAPSLHKYDAASFHHIDPYFGPDPEGDLAQIARETADPTTWGWTAADSLFLHLLEAAHARGMRVVIDGVFNHTGTRFFAFEDFRASREDSPYWDWYLPLAADDPATPEDEFDWQGWWDYRGLPVFADNAHGTDLHSGPKAYVFAITRRWMDPDGDGDPSDGIDGWRLDVAEEVPVGFWQDWHALVRSINPEAYTVAEVWGDATDFLDEGGFTATKNYFGFAIPTEAFLIDGRIGAEQYAQNLTERTAAYPLESARVLMNLIDSHDTDRVASMLVNAGMQANFDREVSPRYSEVYDPRAPNAAERDLQRMIAVLQATLVGAPMLYYGTEAGMWGADDPDDRKPMVWPGLTYTDECLDPRGQERACDPVAFDGDLFDFYQQALALRRNTPALRYGTFEVLAAADAAETLAFARRHEGEEWIVMLNRSDAVQRIRFGQRGADAPLVPIFTSRGEVADIASLNVTIPDEGSVSFSNAIPPRTVVVFRRATQADVRPYGLDE
ncbi:MAG: DUF3459 domain-containing protein [Rhodothermaceae bacterium]|nr:DUF3459 domain-containing protein [Rhodothermaceae bacterium]